MTTRRVPLALCAVAIVAGFTHAAITAPEPPAAPVSEVVTYEDGSGVQYIDGREVATFPEDTFVWDCNVMGNRRCGSDDAR